MYVLMYVCMYMYIIIWIGNPSVSFKTFCADWSGCVSVIVDRWQISWHRCCKWTVFRHARRASVSADYLFVWTISSKRDMKRVCHLYGSACVGLNYAAVWIPTGIPHNCTYSFENCADIDYWNGDSTFLLCQILILCPVLRNNDNHNYFFWYIPIPPHRRHLLHRDWQI